MIFAAWDYLRYRLGKGVYSPSQLQRQGARLGTRENFMEIANCKPMDLFLLHTRKSFLSWMVMYYTNSIWSHVGMFAENGQVIDATTGGVFKHHFCDYCDGSTYIAIWHLKGVTDEKREKAIRWSERQIGKAYNWAGVVRLFLMIILGKKEPYRFRFFLDFVVLMLPIAAFGLWHAVFYWLAGAVIATYGIAVAINVLRR
jgi:hypothetical protein